VHAVGSTKAIADRFWDALESADFATIRQLMTPTTESTMPGGMRAVGPDQLIPVLQMYIRAFPDMKHHTISFVENGNAVAVELRVTGTHTGPMITPTGEIPPTGKKVVWESVDMITVNGDKIATWHGYFDQMSFLAQLGLLPTPTAA
jgi:steroid delta-isomerase-like uncharacterized protein